MGRLTSGNHFDMIVGPAQDGGTPWPTTSHSALEGGKSMPQKSSSTLAPGQFSAYISGLSGRHLGRFKQVAAAAGLTLEDYVNRLDAGEKRCTKCKQWLPRFRFGADETRWDGLDSTCFECRRQISHDRYTPVPAEQRKPMGPPRHDPRDGDKIQARHLINLDVKSGKRPSPNDLPCSECGHKGDDRRHEYHHHMGYASQHHYDVVPVCTTCHSDVEERKQTRCKHGHEFTPENSIAKTNGSRQCRECTRKHDRGRRDAEFWREYRAKRKQTKDQNSN